MVGGIITGVPSPSTGYVPWTIGSGDAFGLLSGNTGRTAEPVWANS